MPLISRALYAITIPLISGILLSTLALPGIPDKIYGVNLGGWHAQFISPVTVVMLYVLMCVLRFMACSGGTRFCCHTDIGLTHDIF